jgi:hypothetical protein
MRTLERLDLTEKSSWIPDNSDVIAHQLGLETEDNEEFEVFLAEFIRTTVINSSDNCTSFLAPLCINLFYASKRKRD